MCVCTCTSNSLHFIRVEVHGGGSIYTCTHVHQLHYFCACMCTRMTQRQLQSKTLWGQVNYTLSMPPSSYIHHPLIIISLHPSCSISIILYIYIYIYKIIYAQIIAFTPHPWSLIYTPFTTSTQLTCCPSAPPPTPVHGDPTAPHHDCPSALSVQKDHRQAHMYTHFWSGDHQWVGPHSLTHTQ